MTLNADPSASTLPRTRIKSAHHQPELKMTLEGDTVSGMVSLERTQSTGEAEEMGIAVSSKPATLVPV